MTTHPQAIPRTRRLRFRLWWMLALVLACALAFGGWAKVDRERRAAERARRAAELAEVERELVATMKSVAAAKHLKDAGSVRLKVQHVRAATGEIQAYRLENEVREFSKITMKLDQLQSILKGLEARRTELSEQP